CCSCYSTKPSAAGPARSVSSGRVRSTSSGARRRRRSGNKATCAPGGASATRRPPPRRHEAMESIALTLPAALVMGLSFGAGPCNVTCLPYGPVLLAREGGGRRSWRTMAPFSAGHLAGYGALGGIAGLLGHTLQAWLRSPAVQWLLGTATILVG